MNKKDWLPAALGALFVLLQISVLPRLGAAFKQLDLLLSLVIAYALVRGVGPGALFGLGVGILRGILAGPAFAFYAIPFFVIGYYVGQFSLLVYRNSTVVPFVVAAVASGFYWLLMTMMAGGLYGFWISGPFWLGLPMSIFGNALLTAAFYAYMYDYYLQTEH